MKNPGGRAAGWLLLAGLAASLTLNGFLAGTLRESYRQQLAAQVWPDPGRDQPVITGTTKGFNRTILLVGDSRMAEWNLPAPPATRLVNVGRRRATTAQLLPLLPAWLATFQPDLVIIEAGINDLKYLGLEPGRAPELITLTGQHLRELARQSQVRHCPVMLLTVWPPDRPDWRRELVWNAAISESVNTLNQQMLAAPVTPEFEVIDVFARAGLSPGPATYRDALHLQPAAYQRLTAALTNAPAWCQPAPLRPANHQ